MRKGIATFLIHECIFLIVIVVFYFVIAGATQEYGMKRDIYYLVKTFMSNTRRLIGSTSVLPDIENLVSQQQLDDAQKAVVEQNKPYLTKLLIGVPVAVILSLIVAYFLDPSGFLHSLFIGVCMAPFAFLAETIIAAVFIYSSVLFDMTTVLSIAATISSEFSYNCTMLPDYLKRIIPTYLWDMVGLSW